MELGIQKDLTKDLAGLTKQLLMVTPDALILIKEHIDKARDVTRVAQSSLRRNIGEAKRGVKALTKF
jgi:hypothetical protein